MTGRAHAVQLPGRVERRSAGYVRRLWRFLVDRPLV